MGGHAKLADQHHVQANLKSGGDFVGNRNTTAWQAENNHIIPLCVFQQRLHQASAGSRSVTQGHLQRRTRVHLTPS
jgi:hypothetical protein